MSETIEQARDRIEARHGPWTSSSIHLGEGVHTFPPWLDTRLRRIVQIAQDVLGGPVADKRVLDLACLEGQLGIEFALHGAEVVAIEGRETNRAKAQFAKDALGLANYTPLLGDVRDLGAGRHGSFDLVLCAGILYHLEAGDAVELMRSIGDVCRRAVIVDTHIASAERHSFERHGHTYWGEHVEEHPRGATAEEIEASLWYAIDDKNSFKFTTDSLVNLLRHAGFTSVFEVLSPYEYFVTDAPGGRQRLVERGDRIMLMAIKGEPAKVISSPLTDATPERDRPERSEFGEGLALFERVGRAADRVLGALLRRGRTFTRTRPPAWRERPSWRDDAADRRP